MNQRERIQKLEVQAAQAEAEREALHAGLADLGEYLTSSKFSDDPMVHVQDVLNRLRDALSAATDVAVQDWGRACPLKVYTDLGEVVALDADRAKMEPRDWDSWTAHESNSHWTDVAPTNRFAWSAGDLS